MACCTSWDHSLLAIRFKGHCLLGSTADLEPQKRKRRNLTLTRSRMFRAKAQPPARSGLHPGSARVGSFGPETEKWLNVLRIDTGAAFLSNEIDVAAALANHLCASSIALFLVSRTRSHFISPRFATRNPKLKCRTRPMMLRRSSTESVPDDAADSNTSGTRFRMNCLY